MKSITFSRDKKKLDIFLKKIDIPKKFWVITFFGYLIGFSLKGFGTLITLPLIKGLIDKDYSFIFDNHLVIKVASYFPFINNLSDNEVFIMFTLVIVSFMAAGMFVRYLVSMYIWHEKQKFIIKSNSVLLDYWLQPEDNSFSKKKTSEIHNKIVQVEQHLNSYVTTSGQLLNLSFDLLSSFAVLLFISKSFSLIALCFLVVYFSIFLSIRKMVRKKALKAQDSIILQKSLMQDILQRYNLIKIFNTQKKEKKGFREAYDKLVINKGAVEKVNSIIEPATTIFEMMSLLGMGFIIAKAFFVGGTVGITSGFVFIVLFQRSLSNTRSFSNIFFRRKIFIDLLSKILDEGLDTQSKKIGVQKFKGLKDLINIKNLTFKYNDNYIFKNFNTNIEAGKINMIIGSNGSGKTTLVSLITRLKETPENSIFFDDIDVLDFNVETLRNKISYVAQDIQFFYGTLRENLSYAFEVSDDEIFSTLEKVGLKDFVMNLPEGLDTKMGNDGLFFSGGQRQKFAISQAILNNSDIVIFDEATKSIDTETENIIIKMLKEDFKEKTRIIISHNPDHLVHADNVIKLD